MTDEDRATLREQIEGLTIREARARAEQATETLKILGELGIGAAPPVGARIAAKLAVVAMQPFPCAHCHRTGPIQPGEAGGAECIACGNPTPPPAGVRMSNKGPVGLTAEERARKLTQPAFDASGEPIS